MRVVDLNIDFMGKRQVSAAISASLVLLSVIMLFVSGLNLGLDFTGGTLVEVEFNDATNPNDIRRLLETEGFEKGIVQI